MQFYYLLFDTAIIILYFCPCYVMEKEISLHSLWI